MSAAFGDQRLPERFWSKVRVDEATGCWEWIAGQNGAGYGSFYVGRDEKRCTVKLLAHRHAYSTLVEPVPDGLALDHLCLNTLCCNPSHVEPVTLGENTRRWAKTLRYCINGHDYSEPNIYYNPRNGRRQCRICRREANQRSVRKARASA